MNTPRTTHTGFTIVETLVAITILMIAIAGPLTVASQALHAAQDAKNQMIASNLAQEAIEEVRNLKDIGIASNTLGQIFGSYQDPAVLYGIEVSPGSGYVIGPCVSLGSQNCGLFLSSDKGYTYNPSGTPTPFQRSIVLTPIGDPATATEYVLMVTVAWTTGAAPNQMQIVELLSSTPR